MNQFEAVCKLASDEGWCWDLNCTTCGNMLFTYAFKQMSYGQSPEDDDWLINTDVEHEKLFAKYGRPVGPPYYKVPLSDFGKEILIKICSEARISKSCRELCLSRVAILHGLGIVWFENQFREL